MKRSFASALGLGFAGGCLGGAVMGAAEGWWVLAHASGGQTVGVLGYAMLLYGAAGAAMGLCIGAAFAIAGRVFRRDTSDGKVYAAVTALVIVIYTCAFWRFLIWRDVFLEKVPWASLKWRGWQAAIFLGCAVLVLLFWKLVGRLLDIVSKRFVLRAWFMPAVILVVSLVLFGWAYGMRGAGAHAPGPAGKTAPKGPNVLLVMVDTLRADRCDPYGAKGMTPALAKLAAQGVTFKHAYAQASWTRPSTATVLSGRYPSSHKAVYKMDRLPESVETLAEVMQGGGYRTEAIITNYVTSPYFGFAQGFDRYAYLEPTYFLGADDASSKLILYESLKMLWSKFVVKGARPGAFYQDGKALTDAALEWVDGWNKRARADDRFFLFLQYMDPHDPYFAHPDDGKAVARKAWPRPPDAWLGRMKQMYDGEVRFFDKHFGRLLGALERQSWWDDTLVVFFSDHGEEFLEHDGWWHGDTLYDEQIRVPIIVKLPKGEGAGQVIDGSLVGLVDIAPTICRLAGVPVPKSFEGQDLFEARAEPLFAEEDHVGNVLRSVMVLKGDAFWKAITANPGNPRELPEKSFFDLGADPGEAKNLADAKKEELAEALRSIADIEGQIAKGAVKRSSIELDKSAKDHLKDLGYIRE